MHLGYVFIGNIKIVILYRPIWVYVVKYVYTLFIYIWLELILAVNYVRLLFSLAVNFFDQSSTSNERLQLIKWVNNWNFSAFLLINKDTTYREISRCADNVEFIAYMARVGYTVDYMFETYFRA